MPRRTSGPLVSLSARKAVCTRFKGPDHPDTLKASAELRFESLKIAITDALAEPPEMTGAERRALAEMLLPEGWQAWPPMPDPLRDFVDRALR